MAARTISDLKVKNRSSATQAATDLPFTSSFHKSADTKATYIVVLRDEPLARYSGGLAGYPATSLQAANAGSGNTRATRKQKLDVASPDSVRYLSYLADQRTAAVNQASGAIGRNLDVIHEYAATLVGFAAELTADEARRLADLDEVQFVEVEKVSQLHTDAGPFWSGAAAAWGGGWTDIPFDASLSGDNEVPPVTSSVTGTATFFYDYSSNTLSYDIQVTSPGPTQLTGMHLHRAPAGSNGGVIFNFGIATTLSINEVGDTVLSDENEAALSNGELYLNVHSDANPAGEIRGQLIMTGNMGEGVVVGIIDTGIDPFNPSFLAVGDDGYVHTNPFGTGTYVGVCDPTDPNYDPAFACNDKLIGAWGFASTDTDPTDTDGHGSHVAGTAAGNLVLGSEITTPTETFQTNISGVAPHANIIAYAACCTGAALAAARDQALLDGVDVINYSIGSSAPTGNFWGDSESLQWLALRDAGVFVATSNGNSGNGDASTGSPADVPWLTSVGANSHNRAFQVTLTATDSTNTSVQVTGLALSGAYGPAELILSTNFSDNEATRLCAPGIFPPGTFSGEIVVCERGIYGRVAKGQAVLDGGAGGMVLAQPEEEAGGPGAVATDAHVLPAMHIDYFQYQPLRQFLLNDASGTVTGELSGAVADSFSPDGDIMATFSSRGPNGTDADLIVPSLTGPGRAIWAAHAQGSGGAGDFTFNVLQGTSMSSPHVAGTAALLSELKPSWTPAQIQSALMMTALDFVRDDDGATTATPFAQGSGHVWLADAINSPLIMDITKQEYEDANPAVDNAFGVRDLNTASLGEDKCIGVCSWTRTVTNATSDALTFNTLTEIPPGLAMTVTPDSFSLAAGDSQELVVEVEITDTALADSWQFIQIEFAETGATYPTTHWPVAVRPAVSNLPEKFDIETSTTSGSVSIDDIRSLAISNMNLQVTGLITADRHQIDVVQDQNLGVSFPDIFFDDPATTQFIPIDVPADSFSVIAEIVDSVSPDLDMLLFLDGDGNGPDLADVGDPQDNPDACQSASGGSLESCEVLSPTAGTWYVALLNYAQATDGGDPTDLATVVIPVDGVDEGNFIVSGPASAGAGTPYSLTLDYNEPGMTGIDKLYGYFTVGSDFGASAGDIGTVQVNLTYLGVPDIEIDPASLGTTLGSGESGKESFALSSTGGVLDWSLDSIFGIEAVLDGSLEQGYSGNPYWRGSSTVASTLLPICSGSTCGVALARTGDWYLWLGGSDNITSFAEQDIVIAPGDQANLSFYMLMATADPNTAIAALTISIDGETIAEFTEADRTDFSIYTQVILPVAAYADGASHLLRFDFVNAQTANFNMFVDDISLISGNSEQLCNPVQNISWLSTSPSSGMVKTFPNQIEATFNAAGLAPGDYSDALCISSNDPDEPQLAFPVSLKVEDDRTLSVGLAGSGSGTVTSTPAGIDCGAECSVAFPYNIAVSLNATADAGSVFAGWGGDEDCQNGVVITGVDVSCTAVFELGDPPSLAKQFLPDTIASGGISTLRFTLDNTASIVDVSGVTFSDSFPAGLTIASPANLTTTCAGTAVDFTEGGALVTVSGGLLAAGANCTIELDVTAPDLGEYMNMTSELASSLGTSTAASDTLMVIEPTPPGAPSIVAATPGDGSAAISFAPPASAGSSFISNYQTRCTPGPVNVNGAQSPINVTGLTNEQVYQCQVRARNDEGYGPFSVAVNVIPTANTMADLSITKTNGSNYVQGGEATVYTIQVNNAGPAGVTDARVTDVLGPAFSNAGWTCSGQDGGQCEAGGNGSIDTLVTLPAGSSVTFELSAVVARLPEDPVSNTASVSPPDGITDEDLGNNEATDGPDEVGAFRDGFE